jgi:hypothetical protein
MTGCDLVALFVQAEQGGSFAVHRCVGCVEVLRRVRVARGGWMPDPGGEADRAAVAVLDREDDPVAEQVEDASFPTTEYEPGAQ